MVHYRAVLALSSVRPNVPRHATQDEQVGEHVDHVSSLQLARHADSQALSRELVDHVQHPELAALVRAGFDELVGADVITPFRFEPDAGPIPVPQPALLRLARRYLEPVAPPDPLDSLVVDEPAHRLQQCTDLHHLQSPRDRYLVVISLELYTDPIDDPASASLS
ncbi:hypothetical protein ASF55_16395 [Methylobacterium sp. Leaf119]|nr:hypothetical protein ASF55_16395 [Methylobacterium sp. Leaf119]